MRRAAPLLLLLAAAAASDVINTTTVLANDTILLGEHAVFISNDTIVDGNKTIVIGNDTIIETDGEHAPIIRKKRTFGELVFRGLADVLGYDVQRKPQAAADFPPPLAPVPGIDTPWQAAPAPPPPCAAPRAAPPPCAPPRPPPPPPCPAPKAAPPPCPAPKAAPPPCPPPRPKPPPPPPPCPKPRAAPRPKPRPPPPPPPPPPPCAKPRANPCFAKDETGAELITSNLQLSFNINRNRPTAPAAESVEEFAPIAIEPRAARLPARQERKPRVFVDAFVVRDGVPQKVDTVDADAFDAQQAVLEDDYIDDEDDEAPQARQVADDDYEDVPEPREKSQRQIGAVVDSFWEHNKKLKKPKKLPRNHYKNVHFGDRELANQLRRRSDAAESHQSLQRGQSNSNRNPVFSRDTDEDEYEGTTTTEDPHRPLRPRVLPPTEHNPNQIDTVTVRVPPIYKEKRPKKLHRGPDRDEEDNQGVPDYYNNSNEDDSDSDGENSAISVQTEQTRRKRGKKLRRRTRSTRQKNPGSKKKKDQEYDVFSELDYDYYGRKLPVSDEEKAFRLLVVTDPPKDADLARLEESPFLDDHERLVEDPERIGEEERLDDKGRSDESGRTDENEKIVEDPERSYDDTERTDDQQRQTDSRERTDELSPDANIHETGYRNNYLKRTGIRVDNPNPLPQRVPKKRKA